MSGFDDFFVVKARRSKIDDKPRKLPIAVPVSASRLNPPALTHNPKLVLKSENVISYMKLNLPLRIHFWGNDCADSFHCNLISLLNTLQN